jgi:hypothetical protein
MFMRARKHNKNRCFVQYDDNCAGHVLAGPEYGQPWRSSAVWDEIESTEFTSLVEEIQLDILRRGRFFI